MEQSNESYPYFMSHPFWRLLRIGTGSPVGEKLRLLDDEARGRVIAEAVKGFYPVSYASLLAFRRFSELADHPEAKAIAFEIHAVESGNKPLIEGSAFTGVRHCDQLKIMFESLLGRPLPVDDPETFEVLTVSDISQASLPKAMAICEVIEHTAPFVIHFYQDFLVQCQVAMDIPSEKVQRNYLDEHNLTEGDACEAQHIDMLGRMMAPYADVQESPAFREEKARFIHVVCDHFEHHRQAILAVLYPRPAA